MGIYGVLDVYRAEELQEEVLGCCLSSLHPKAAAVSAIIWPHGGIFKI